MILRGIEFVSILLVFVLILRTIVLMLLTSAIKPVLAPLIRESKRAEFLKAEFVYGLPLPLSALVVSYSAIRILGALHYGRAATVGLLCLFIVYAVLSHGNKVVSLQSGVPNVPPSLIGIITEILMYLAFLKTVGPRHLEAEHSADVRIVIT
jgi:hypothetical protein